MGAAPHSETKAPWWTQACGSYSCSRRSLLAATHGDLLFVALFGTVSVVTTIEAVQALKPQQVPSPVVNPT